MGSWVAALSCVAAFVTAALTFWVAKANQSSADTARGLYQAELVKMRDTAEKDSEEKRKELEQRRKEVEEKGAEIARAWKRSAVYGIVSQQMIKGKWNGLTIADIRKGLEEEAVKNLLKNEANISSKDISESEIKRLLLDLMETQIIFHTVEDHYTVDFAAVNPRWRESAEELLLAFEISKALDNKGRGVFEWNELRDEVGKAGAVRTQVYNAVMRELQRQGFIEVKDGKVRPVGNSPAKNDKEVKE